MKRINGSLHLMTIGPEPLTVDFHPSANRVRVFVPKGQQIANVSTKNLHAWKFDAGDGYFIFDLEEVPKLK